MATPAPAPTRVYYGLQHLWTFRGPVPPGYVPLASVVKARPYRVGLAEDLAVVTFLVPPEGWGIDAAQVDPEEGPPVVIAGVRVPLILERETVQ